MAIFRFVPALLLSGVLMGLAACGGGSDTDGSDTGGALVDASSAPTDADVADFCRVWEDYAMDEAQLGEDVGDWPERLAEVGTPADISADQRRGFELYVTTYDAQSGNLRPPEAGEIVDDISWGEAGLTEEEQDDVHAFYYDYVYDHCEPYGEHE